MERGNTPTPPLSEVKNVPSPLSSPPPNCSICLGKLVDASSTESCAHEFCFLCLAKWSKVKRECPLCKKRYNTIIHKIPANEIHGSYIDPDITPAAVSEFASALQSIYAGRYRYRTTVTLSREDDVAVQRLLHSELPEAFRRTFPAFNSSIVQSRTCTDSFRRTVYQGNLWATSLPDITGRFRECSPDFYRENPSQITRLVPWLNRELSVFNLTSEDIWTAVSRISEALMMYLILSRQFRDVIANIIPHDVEHFIHELHAFASSPYDMLGFDRNANYQSGRPRQPVTDLSSTDSENDLYLISPERPMTMAVSQTNPENRQTNLTSISNPIVIETVSHSETEDSSDEVVFSRYIKPPEQRTPEIIDLLGSSDSDVVLVEEQPSAPSPFMERLPSPHTPPPNLPSTSGLVKMSLKRDLSPTISLSDSDSDYSVKLSSSWLKRFKNKIPKMRRKSASSDFESESSMSSSPRRSRCSTPSSHSCDRFSSVGNNCNEEEEPAADTALNNGLSSTSTQESKKKVKKNKHKKQSKKILHSSKKKRKSKSKKKHKNKDRSDLSKGKYCKNSKSKIKVPKD